MCTSPLYGLSCYGVHIRTCTNINMPVSCSTVVFRHVAMHEELPFAMSAIGHMPLLTMTYACVGEWVLYVCELSTYVLCHA